MTDIPIITLTARETLLTERSTEPLSLIWGLEDGETFMVKVYVKYLGNNKVLYIHSVTIFSTGTIFSSINTVTIFSSISTATIFSSISTVTIFSSVIIFSISIYFVVLLYLVLVVLL